MSRPGVGSPDEFFDAVNKIECMVENEKKWSSNNIMIEVATSLTDDTPMTINLSSTIGDVRFDIDDVVDDSSCYFLRQSFSQNDPEFRKIHLSPHFVLPCAKAGFTLVTKGWESKRYMS